VTPADQVQAPVAVPQQQPAAEAPASDTQAPAAVSPSSQSDNSSTDTTDNSAAETTPPERPITVKAKPSRIAPPAGHTAEVTAADSTTEIALPPAPLVVEGGKRHVATSSPSTDTQVAPPSLDTVAGAAKPGLGPVMNAAPVGLPKLAAVVPPKRVKVSQGVTQGLLVRQVRPQYPSMARESRVEGDVLLEALISKDGSVSDVRAISGPALLIPPALQAVRQWRYKPYLLNGEPVEVETQIKVQFRL
ncbi:MAG TPA: TonB family protein, partial [Terriglobales bacterium]|nr:TonB family protein [Terriglobales bacterium]